MAWGDRARSASWWGLAAVLLVAAVLRFHELGARSLWLDEGTTWVKTLHGPLWIIEDSIRFDPHPPLFYLVVDAWTAIAGSSEVALRTPSAIFSLATVPVVYLLGRDLFDARAGLVASAVLALSEFQLIHAQDARMYAMVGFFAAVATLAHHRVFARGVTRRRLAVYVGAAVLLVYTHLLGWLVVGALWLHGLVALRVDSVPDPVEERWTKAQVWLGIAFLPWAIPLVVASSRVASGFWAPSADLADLWGTLVTFAGNGPIAAAMGVLALVGLTASPGRYPEPLQDRWRDHGLALTLLVAPPIALFVASKLIQPVYIDRYLIGASLGLYLLAARGATVFDRASTRPVLLAVLLVASGVSAHEAVDRDEREAWASAAKEAVVDSAYPRRVQEA